MTMTPEQLREWADAIESGNWPIGGGMVAITFRAHADALEELAKLRARLEIDPRHSYDGIAARDETIRLLEAALAESERKCELLTKQIKELHKELNEEMRAAAANAAHAERHPDEPYGCY